MDNVDPYNIGVKLSGLKDNSFCKDNIVFSRRQSVYSVIVTLDEDQERK